MCDVVFEYGGLKVRLHRHVSWDQFANDLATCIRARGAFPYKEYFAPVTDREGKYRIGGIATPPHMVDQCLSHLIDGAIRFPPSKYELIVLVTDSEVFVITGEAARMGGKFILICSTQSDCY